MNDKLSNTIPPRVILTSGTSVISLIAAHSLGKRGLEIIGAGCVPHTPLSFSKYVSKNEVYKEHTEDPEQFLNDLERIIKDNRPVDENTEYILMPTFKETSLVAKNKERFSKYITVACPDPQCIDKIYPKQNLATSISKLDVRSPLSFLPLSANDISEIESNLDYPVLIKPYNESGGRGIKKVYSRLELLKAIEEYPKLYGNPPLVQQIVDGDDYCFTGLFDKGSLKASMAYENLKRFPVKSGSSVMRETINDTPFRDIAVSLLGPLKWSGVAQVDFMWNGLESEKPFLIEVNPRFWAGLYQSIQAGVDYPWLSYLLFTGKDLPEDIHVTLGNRTKLPGTWILTSIQESLRLEDGFKNFTEAGKDALEKIKDGKPLSALKTFAKGIAEGFDPAESFRRLMDALEEGDEAESELKLENDPYIILGSLYVMEYFFKYKKLPPQFSF